VAGARIEEVIRLAAEAGVPTDLFRGWEGQELALYRGTAGRSASVGITHDVSPGEVPRQDWTLDLGNRAVSIPRAQGEALKSKLDSARISYATGSLANAYMRRVHEGSSEYEAALRHLAKR
jgi:hypothetical protein